MMMTNRERLATIQSAVLAVFEDSLVGTQESDVRTVVRVVLEFDEFLRQPNPDTMARRYACETIFAAVESFCSTVRTAGVLDVSDTVLGTPMTIGVEPSATAIETCAQFLAEGEPVRKLKSLIEAFRCDLIVATLQYQ